MKYIVALHKFFGLKPGQSLADFKAEVGKLTDKDKADLVEMLAAHYGEPIEVS